MGSIGSKALREGMFESANGQLMLLILRVFVRVADGHISVFPCASCGEGANPLGTFTWNVPRFGEHPHPRAMYIIRLSWKHDVHQMQCTMYIDKDDRMMYIITASFNCTLQCTSNECSSLSEDVHPGQGVRCTSADECG